MSEALTYTVSGMSCEHCKHAIDSELRDVGGVEEVDVDLRGKLVTVRGERLDDATLRRAIEAAGYEAAGYEAA